MSRFFLSLLALMAFFTCALASPNVIKGEVTVAHGWVKQPDGTRLDISGMKLPYVAYKIDAVNMTKANASRTTAVDSLNQWVDSQTKGPGGGIPLGGGGIDPVSDTTVYDTNDQTYGFIEDNPSSLDDIELTAGGVGRPWTQLGFAFNDTRSSFSSYIMRWRIWQNNVDNPSPQNDFSGEIADFGVIWTTDTTGSAYYVVISVAQAGITAPQTSLYMAEQFRELQLDGEGAFIPQINVVFTGSPNPPLVGNSMDQFWYDWDPLDGNYENTEIDQFEGSYADITYTIKVSSTGTQVNLLPNKVTMERGFLVSGTYDSLQYASDGDVLTVKPLGGLNISGAKDTFDVEANCPTATPLSIAYEGIGYTGSGTAHVQVSLWDYVNSQWVVLNNNTITASPSAMGATYGGSVPLSNFVSTTTPRKVRARLIVAQSRPPRGIKYYFDEFNWIITRP